jgi:NAD(P)-dependent dehydrogenase (short-subunit alcohol dehydrogenase family)
VAICKRLAAEGAYVLIIDPDPYWVQTLESLIKGNGGRCEGHIVEIGNFEALEGLARGWLHEGKVLDALVTCYLDIEWQSIENGDITAFERVVLFNLVGPVKSTKAFLPLLKRAQSASIVHIGSVDGLLGAPAVPSYSTSKGGLVPLTHVSAYELAPYGIRVNTIASCQTIEAPREMLAPGGAPIAFHGFPGPGYLAQLNAATPLKRQGPLSDWAGAVVFLVSTDAAYVTGAVLVVDCGRTVITPGTQLR